MTWCIRIWISGVPDEPARSCARGDDTAWSLGFAGIATHLQGVFGDAGGLHFKCSAKTLAGRKLGGDRLSRDPQDLYSLHDRAGSYLAFLGRISPEKCPDHAIEVAKRVGMPLRIAAKVDAADHAYFKQKIERLLDHPLVEYVGEINDAEKNDFLGDAAALLCPYDWPEPFGLVLIEAMACGTPVLAYRQGSIPEIIDHGVTGYICDNIGEMAQAVAGLPLIDRKRCREVFEKRFTVERMANDYLNLYESLVAAPLRPRLLARSASHARVGAVHVATPTDGLAAEC